MHQRVPTLSPPTRARCWETAKSSENRRSTPRRSFSARRSSTDLYLKKCATAASRVGRRRYHRESAVSGTGSTGGRDFGRRRGGRYGGGNGYLVPEQADEDG